MSTYLSVPRPAHRRGFTLIELLVVIAIIAILAAILFPVFAQARAKARQTACLSNEKQMGSALMMYAQDFDETLPIANYGGNGANIFKWMDMIYPYVKSIGAFNCPTNLENSLDFVPCNLNVTTNTCTNRTGYRFGTYAINSGNYRGHTYTGNIPSSPPIGAPLAAIKVPANTVFLTEVIYANAGYTNATIAWDSDVQNPFIVKTTSTWSISYTQGGTNKTLAPLAHNNGTNVLWCDGHAKWQDGDSLIATHNISGHDITYLWTIEED